LLATFTTRATWPRQSARSTDSPARVLVCRSHNTVAVSPVGFWLPVDRAPRRKNKLIPAARRMAAAMTMMIIFI